jgi:hypothetical protein
VDIIRNSGIWPPPHPVAWAPGLPGRPSRLGGASRGLPGAHRVMPGLTGRAGVAAQERGIHTQSCAWTAELGPAHPGWLSFRVRWAVMAAQHASRLLCRLRCPGVRTLREATKLALHGCCVHGVPADTTPAYAYLRQLLCRRAHKTRATPQHTVPSATIWPARSSCTHQVRVPEMHNNWTGVQRSWDIILCHESNMNERRCP